MQRLRRVREILEKAGLDALLFTFPKNVRYLTQFTGSNGQVLVTPGETLLLTDGRYTVQAKKEVKGAEVVIYAPNQFTATALQRLTAGNAKVVGFEGEQATYAQYGRWKREMKSLRFVDVSSALSSLRVVKDEDEVQLIKNAAKIATESFLLIKDQIKPGMKEKDLAFEFEYAMRKRGADALAFPLIVASGRRSAMPHGMASDQRIEKDTFLTLDFGCVSRSYCSDETLTLGLGKLSRQQQKVYAAVKEAHDTALGVLKAGVTGKAVDEAARQVITKAGYGPYFVHSTGHGVGLHTGLMEDVHEPPILSAHSTEPLPENTIVTVEPGIYLPRRYGVRIESLVRVTKDGYEALTTLPKDLEVL